MPFKKLLRGYREFHKSYFGAGRESSIYDELRKGQTPEMLVIACCDSRADPALIAKAEPGTFFVVRNVAAIVPPYKLDDQHHGTSAAIEFAVRTLKVKHISIMGHSMCGGIQALMDRETTKQSYEFLSPWMNIGEQALAAVEQELAGEPHDVRAAALEQSVILVSLNNLMTFPWLAERVKTGDLQLHGWHFNLETGILMRYNYTSGVFEEISPE